MTTILWFIVVLGVVIFVHELGHFLAAKAAGVRVLTFSLGFGKKVLGFRRGDTHYVISALPLGGYVKMAGEVDEMMGEEIEREEDLEFGPGDFMYAGLPRRFGIIAAGPGMNILLAFFIYFGVVLLSGLTRYPTTEIGHFDPDAPALAREVGLRPGDRIVSVDGVEYTDWASATGRIREGLGKTHTVVVDRDGARLEFRLPSLLASDGGLTPALADSAGGLPRRFDPYGFNLPFGSRLSAVVDSGAAAMAGIRAGDRIVRINGRPVERYWQLVKIVRASPGIPLEVTYLRDGEEHTTLLTPGTREDPRGEKYGYIGVYSDLTDLPMEQVRLNLIEAVSTGAAETWRQGQLVLQVVGGLVTGRISMKKGIGGPVMIARAAGDRARGGLQSLLLFVAWLSVNLGILNLLPIPVLDGGHIVFLTAEAMRGRPLSLKVRLVATQVGMAFLLLTMIYVTYNDIVRYLF